MTVATAAPVPSSTHGGLGLSDWPVGVKIAAIAALGLLTAVVVGVAGQRQLASADRNAAAVLTDQARPAIALGSTRESFARVRSRLAQAAAYDQQKDIDTALSKLTGYEKAVLDGLDAFGTAPLTARQRQVLDDELRPSVTAAFAVVDDQLVPLADHPMTAAERRMFAQVFNTRLRPPLDAAQSALDTIVKLTDERLTAAENTAAAGRRRAAVTNWIVTVLGAILTALAGAVVVRVITRPLHSVQAALTAMADGDLSVEAQVTSQDELGRMAAALTSAQRSLREVLGGVASSSAVLAESATELTRTSDEVARSAADSSARSVSAAGAAEEVSDHVQTAAAATEEMAASIREISQSSADAVRIAAEASGEVERATSTVARLGESSAEIGSEEILRRMPPDRRNGRRACIHAGCAIRALDAGRATQAAAHAEAALQHLDRVTSWLQILLLEIATAAEPPSATWRRYSDASSRVRWNLAQVLVTGARRQIAAEKALLDHQRVSKRAYVDHLTGLANRHAHDRHLARLRTADPADGLTLLMIDVDHFKLINDRFGHAAGDEVLRRLGSILTRATRPSDLAVRLGGDEFLLMISHGLPDAEDRARDLLDHVATHPWHEVAPGLTVGLSIGVISGAARDVDHLLDAGDRCLYDAKRSGRGQIVHAPRS